MLFIELHTALQSLMKKKLSFTVQLCIFLTQLKESRLCAVFAASTPVYQAIPITLLHSSCLLSAVTWISLNPFESVADWKNAHSCCTYFSKRVVFVVYFPRQCCPSNPYLLSSCLVLVSCQLWHWSVWTCLNPFASVADTEEKNSWFTAKR